MIEVRYIPDCKGWAVRRGIKGKVEGNSGTEKKHSRKRLKQLVVVAHACNFITQEAEAEGS
jgi:hypothetical protein